MDLTQYKIDKYEDNVADLPDYPSDEGYTAAQLKAVFDGRGDKEIKEKHNELIDELQGIVADLKEADGTAEQNAKEYADSLAGNYDAAGSAEAAEQNAKSYTDTLQSNLTGGSVRVKLAQNADYASSANEADIAERDHNDQVIHETYETKTDASSKLAEAKAYTNTLKNNLERGYVTVFSAETDLNGNAIHETYETNAEASSKLAEAKAYTDSEVDTLQTNLTSCEKSENKGMPDGYAPLDSAGKVQNEFLYGQTVKEYGVRWKGTASTVCERLGDAVGLVANAQLGVVSTVQNDFDNIYPWSEMRLCNLDAEGNILAYAGEPTFTRDGTNGDVMVEIPKFYYKRRKTEKGYEEWWICAVKLPGYEIHPVFMDDGKEVSAVFHSAYNANEETLDDGTTILRSISGAQPAVNITRAEFRTRARNKGTSWGIEDVSCMHALQMLYLVEYANTNSQTKLGNGASSLNYTETHLAVEAGKNTNEFVTTTATASKYRVGERIEIGTYRGKNNIALTPRTILSITFREDDADISAITFDGDPVASIAVGNMMWEALPLNGSCDELNGGSGYIGTNGKADSAYRGIEGFHGKAYRFIDGVNIKDHLVHYANSMADYEDGVYDGKFRSVGYTNGTATGFISQFGYDEKAPWVMFPTEAIGSSTTYVPDYYYQDAGERLFSLGCDSVGGLYGGVFSLNCRNTFSITSRNYMAHLLIKKTVDTTKKEVEELRSVIHETYVTKEEFNVAIATLRAMYTGGEDGGN